MSPEENNNIAHQFFDTAWNTGVVREDLLHSEAIDHSAVGGEKKVEHGADSFKQIIGMFRSAMPDDIRLDIQDEIFAGDKVVHRWEISGTDTGGFMGMPATGRPISFTGTTIARFQDGKIIERWANVDELGLLQQLGIVPPPPARGD